MKLVGHDPYDV